MSAADTGAVARASFAHSTPPSLAVIFNSTHRYTEPRGSSRGKISAWVPNKRYRRRGDLFRRFLTWRRRACADAGAAEDAVRAFLAPWLERGWALRLAKLGL